MVVLGVLWGGMWFRELPLVYIGIATLIASANDKLLCISIRNAVAASDYRSNETLYDDAGPLDAPYRNINRCFGKHNCA